MTVDTTATTGEPGDARDLGPVLALRGVTVGYGAARDRTPVLADLDLEVADGEFLAVLGFSGSGKTTLVSAIAGLVPVDRGEVVVRGERCTGPGRDRGVVFQNYSLLPWATVEGNIRLAVDAAHRDRTRSERDALVDEAIELVGLGPARDRRSGQLSGGMRQRVAVARALAMGPEILLLDEPLSALDALTRTKLQDEIERIRATDRRTIVMITNDVDEALLLADRVAVLDRGPGAAIGRVFDVDLPRPRLRAEVNDDAAYQRLRHDIITYLDGIGDEKRTFDAIVAAPDAPAIEPADLDPPRAYRHAAESVIDRRYLELFNLTKVYPTPSGPLTVVEDIGLVLDRGDFVSLIGHSGCGKSTVLSMAAGLLDVSDGGIVLDGREVQAAGPDKAVVFQAPSLLPWLTARDNVALGVDRVYPDATKGERREVVEYYLRRVGLGDVMDRRASELSNGMRQRVGLARAFALNPKLLLLDEPFGMLDSLTRWDLQDVLMEIWDRTKVTAICVTHDVDEAILLADRVVMMTDGPNARIGRVLQIDLPRPRDRRTLLDTPAFYAYRHEILSFLENPTVDSTADPRSPLLVG